MSEINIQEQINELNRKMDLILENVELQKRSREEFDDLLADVNIVVRDAFRESVILLDKSQVELDHSGISNLVIRILQNLETFREMLEMMESARDFMKDLSPVLHQVGLDAVHKMNEFEQQGYFEIFRNLTDPGILEGLRRASSALATVKMDEKLDNKSLVGIFRRLNSPEVRKSLSYTLRLVEAMGKS